MRLASLNRIFSCVLLCSLWLSACQSTVPAAALPQNGSALTNQPQVLNYPTLHLIDEALIRQRWGIDPMRNPFLAYTGLITGPHYRLWCLELAVPGAVTVEVVEVTGLSEEGAELGRSFLQEAYLVYLEGFPSRDEDLEARLETSRRKVPGENEFRIRSTTKFILPIVGNLRDAIPVAFRVRLLLDGEAVELTCPNDRPESD